MIYRPLTNNSTPLIIEDIREYLKEDLPSQVKIDTGDLAHLIGEIERLNNIINELEKYLDEALGQDMYRYDFKIILDKLQELKGSDK